MTGMRACWNEQTSFASTADPQTNGAGSESSQVTSCGSSRWVDRVILVDAKGTVRAVEFALHHFGLKLATVPSDNRIRIYECLERSALTTWQLSKEVRVSTFPYVSLFSSYSLALVTLTQTSATLGVLLQPWSLDLCNNCKTPPPRDGEIIAASCGISGAIKVLLCCIFVVSLTLNTIICLSSAYDSPTLDPMELPAEAGPSPARDGDAPTSFVMTSIWQVKPAEEEPNVEGEDDDPRWSVDVVADFNHHKSAVGRVEWNIAGFPQ
ncbi:uncharacterized protein HD556DRAFT_1529902 [Suillus plorans]|uniref:Uncharacterized protein n=1 Tax=Suillus plorans TaxID=116603 RepID=A0A9P7AHN6_9AGAM|nr:uncharacterized protein HD556DRAFT_1529902 [Suillus plorans]KAG1788547.1 hypothetical protein HD556DRAFT_1529902 [Suillus plorans]